MADLTCTVSESVTLNGAVRGSVNTTTTINITDVFERIVTCVNGQETTVARFAAAPYTDPVAIDVDRTKYIRLTNLSTTEDIEVAFVGTATLYQVTLRAGATHLLFNGDVILLAEEDTTPSFGTLEDIASIIVKPKAAVDAQVEVFIGIV